MREGQKGRLAVAWMLRSHRRGTIRAADTFYIFKVPASGKMKADFFLQLGKGVRHLRDAGEYNWDMGEMQQKGLWKAALAPGPAAAFPQRCRVPAAGDMTARAGDRRWYSRQRCGGTTSLI